ncbi:MAG: MMPL family transporter [Candidatus Microthrix sp.]|nr:MMPL family transporter [Candidatus Microthrix sp.]
MSTWLYRIGRFADRRRFWVIGAWLILAVTAVGINRVGGGGTVDNFEVPGVESQAAIDLLKARFPERAGATAMLVFHVSDGVVTDPKNAAGIEQTMAEVRSLDHVLTATDPLTGPMSKSPDGATAFAAVQYDRSTADLGHPAVEALTKTATPATTAGVQVEFGGELPTVLKERTTGPAEMIGMIAALIILFVTFRSVIASVMPLGAAVAGLVVGLSLVGLLGAWINIPSVAPRLGTMIGLGVGIDYALFILSRHRDNLDAGLSNSESIGQTNATAGEAVVVAGGTVVVAILGLQLAGIPFVAALGYSASLVVAVAVAVAITLLPAVLGVVGRRVLPRSHRQVEVRRPVGTKPVDTTGTDGTHSGWVRWAHWVAYHPWRSAITATFVLLLWRCRCSICGSARPTPAPILSAPRTGGRTICSPTDSAPGSTDRSWWWSTSAPRPTRRPTRWCSTASPPPSETIPAFGWPRRHRSTKQATQP